MCPHDHLPDGHIRWDCDDAAPSKPVPAFEVSGISCANPYNSEGPDYAAASRAADALANKKCYPYQFRRNSDYTFSKYDCEPPYYGASASAKYSCAGPSFRTPNFFEGARDLP